MKKRSTKQEVLATNEGTKLTMSSVEIAERTGKRHADLMKSIRAMEVAWVKVNGGKFSLVEYIDSKGEKRPMYVLDHYECMYIATKFNDEARAKLVLRWAELEEEARAKGVNSINTLPAPTPIEEQLLALIEEYGKALKAIDKRLRAVEFTGKTRKAKDIDSDFDLVTIISYCFHKDIRLSPNQRSILAYVCATACNNDNIHYQQGTHGNKYPVWLIDHVLISELSGCLE
ncbi:Rha family transcriptional regulator [Bacteroides fragilis]